MSTVERPSELPAPPANFIDREREQAELHELVRQGTSERLCVVNGRSGVGKSSLALHWAHGVREHFTGGQVYLELGLQGGLDDILEHALTALAKPGESIPASRQDQIGRLRTYTSDRDLLFVFDNVADPAQLRSIMPATPNSLMLCTSQLNAADLGPDGVRSIPLSPLTAQRALEYLRTQLPERVADEPVAANELVELCGRMPIALKLVAGLLRKRQEWPLSRAVAELSDWQRRQKHLAEAFQAIIDFVSCALQQRQRQLYRHLGLVSAAQLTLEAIVALTGWRSVDVEDTLEELWDRYLVDRDDQDQYLLHDLVAEHAAERARELDAETKERALRRLVDWYRRYSAFADRQLMNPERLRVVETAVTGENPFTTTTAREWLERERTNLLALVRTAADRGWHEDVVALCDGGLWVLHNQHKHYRDTLQAFGIAISCANRAGAALAEARMRSLRAQLEMERDEVDVALNDAEIACELAEQAGHRSILASALEFHGKALHARGDYPAAIARFHQARELFAERGRVRGIALQEYLLGRSLCANEQPEEAARTLDAALSRMDDVPDDTRTPARIRTVRAWAHQLSGEYESSIPPLASAIDTLRSRGATFDLAEPLVLLADAHEATDGDGSQHLTEALALYEEADHPRAAEVRERLNGPG